MHFDRSLNPSILFVSTSCNWGMEPKNLLRVFFSLLRNWSTSLEIPSWRVPSHPMWASSRDSTSIQTSHVRAKLGTVRAQKDQIRQHQGFVGIEFFTCALPAKPLTSIHLSRCRSTHNIKQFDILRRKISIDGWPGRWWMEGQETVPVGITE